MVGRSAILCAALRLVGCTYAEAHSFSVLKKSLEALFSTYGAVLSVTAHSNLRMRGQAFIAFDNKEAAAKAIKEVVGFPLYGKPMVSTTMRAMSSSTV